MSSQAQPAKEPSKNEKNEPGGDQVTPERQRARRRRRRRARSRSRSRSRSESASPSQSHSRARGKASESRSLAERAETIYRELSGLFLDVLGEKPAGAEEVKARLVIDTELPTLGVRGGRRPESVPPEKRFVDDLLAKLYMLAQECSVGMTPFPLGKVYCFWCGSYDCAHAEPPESRSVFKEYSPTGQPIWLELGALALEKNHPDIHAFYGERPKPVTLLAEGNSLTRKQLGVYGKESCNYHILGQVVVGYLPVVRGRSEQDRLALTVQAVETQQGKLRCHLNVIGVLPDGRQAGPFLEEITDLRLSDALATARGKLAELSLVSDIAGGASSGGGKTPRGSRRKTRERHAMKILRRLCRNLDQIYRQKQRRTHHAETRHRDRERPASTALTDALKAKRDSIYRDTQAGTWVVVGPRSRVHVFNDAGQHVTSVVYPGETIRNRTAQGRWRRVAREDLQRFRERLQSLGR